ncbi:MAG: penicillin-binding protein 2 [Pseudomonadota bacterium]
MVINYSRRDHALGALVSRRVVIAGAGMGLVTTVLAARLYHLQVTQSERYRKSADDNRFGVGFLRPKRGTLIDRSGKEIATDQQYFDAMIIANMAGDNIDQVLARLTPTLLLTSADIKRIHHDIGKAKGFAPVPIRQNLTWGQVATISMETPFLPGVSVVAVMRRAYPFAQSWAHLTGYVADATERDVIQDRALSLPGTQVGKSGLEAFYEKRLRGKVGRIRTEINALGRVVREVSREPAQTGTPLRLTVDAQLQNYGYGLLNNHKSASAVVMDAHTGQVRALVSSPSFDPNKFATGMDSKTWHDLLHHPQHPLVNKAIAGTYAPGSTFKLVVALAGLEAGVITPQEVISCQGYIGVSDRRFHCWKKQGHGPVDLVQAIAQSCDVYFYQLARRLGIARIAKMAQRYGLGESVGIDLPGEHRGLIPSRAWKMAWRGESWHLGETLITGIGQGYTLTTPLQLAVMTAGIINGGKLLTPYIGIARTPPQEIGGSNIARALVTHAMNEVTSGERGTARGAQAQDPRYRFGGKTGTSQVRSISLSERETGVLKDDEVPWALRDHALFVGFAPQDAPRLVASVIVDHGGSGSSVAAPIAGALLGKALTLSDPWDQDSA